MPLVNPRGLFRQQPIAVVHDLDIRPSSGAWQDRLDPLGFRFNPLALAQECAGSQNSPVMGQTFDVQLSMRLAMTPSKLYRRLPVHFNIHLVVENFATNKHLKVRAWLARRERYRVHRTALHPDPRLLDQPGGTLVPAHHPARHPPRIVLQRQGTGSQAPSCGSQL